jgi:late competence protein required for DNA uptake (superfamily II DNA/RNA helicase)
VAVWNVKQTGLTTIRRIIIIMERKMGPSKCCKAKLNGIVGNPCNIYYCSKCGLCYHKIKKFGKPEEMDEWE